MPNEFGLIETTEEPEDAVARIAEVALNALDAAAKHEGIESHKAVVLLVIDTDGPENDATVATDGIDSTDELLGMLLAHARAAAEAAGIEMWIGQPPPPEIEI